MQAMVYRYKAPEDQHNPNIPALGIMFEEQSQQNEGATRASGFPVFDNVLVAKVFPMGNPKSDVIHEIERTLTDGTVVQNKFYSHKYSEQIKLHKAGNETVGGGTPLTELGGLNAAMIQTFKARGVHSIEALAEAAEAGLNDMMGFRKYTDMARAYLSRRAGDAPMVKLAQDKAELEAKYSALEARFNDLVERLGNPESANKPRRGRPPKAVAA